MELWWVALLGESTPLPTLVLSVSWQSIRPPNLATSDRNPKGVRHRAPELHQNDIDLEAIYGLGRNW